MICQVYFEYFGIRYIAVFLFSYGQFRKNHMGFEPCVSIKGFEDSRVA